MTEIEVTPAAESSLLAEEEKNRLAAETVKMLKEELTKQYDKNREETVVDNFVVLYAKMGDFSAAINELTNRINILNSSMQQLFTIAKEEMDKMARETPTLL